jgi:hypothetical protein
MDAHAGDAGAACWEKEEKTEVMSAGEEAMKQLLEDVLGGHRLTEEEASGLLKTGDRGIWEIVAAADQLREMKVGDTVTYVRNQNLHVTNICKNVCGFCGFGRPRGAEGTFFYGKEQIQEQAALARERGVTEVCLLSGVHPDFNVDSYTDIIKWVREVVPEADIHTGSPDELAWAAKKSGISTEEVIGRVRAAGLGTLQDRRMGADHQGSPRDGHQIHGHHHVRLGGIGGGPHLPPLRAAGYPGRDGRVYRAGPPLLALRAHAPL